MNREWDVEVGNSVDRALSETMDLYFDREWHPETTVKKQRKSRSKWAWAAVSAAAVSAFALVPAAPGIGRTTSPSHALSAPSLSKSVKAALAQFHATGVAVDNMTPVYATYPMAVPTGHVISLSGSFSIDGQQGTSLALEVSNQRNLLQGMLFNQGHPVYQFQGSHVTRGQKIPITSPTTSITTSAIQGGNRSLSSFVAAGSYVYMTHGNKWLVSHSDHTAFWLKSPGRPTNSLDTIAALPRSPQHALLLEQSPSGKSQGFVTTNHGLHWQAWGLGSQWITNLVAMNHRYWSVLNGTLQASTNGTQWQQLLHINTKRWQVEDFAVNPLNSQEIVTALTPVNGNGQGPLLETVNGGKSWKELPHLPALGSAPSNLIMEPNGNIAALINLSRPILVRFSSHRNAWAVTPIPHTHENVSGLGQLAADPQGDLVYASPSGTVFRWRHANSQWQKLQIPHHIQTGAPSLLLAIRNHQIMAGYGKGWYVFVVK